MRFLKAPELFDPDKKSQARLTHMLLLTAIGVLLIYIVITWLFIPTQRERIFLAVTILLFVLISFWLNRSGKVAQAGWVFVFSVWIILTLGMLTNGGVRSPAYIVYIAIVLLAGVLINLRAAVLFSVLSIVLGLVAVWGMERGFIDGLPPALSIWLMVSVSYFIVIALVYFATNSINHALVQAELEIGERKRVEASLRQSEARYKRLLENIWDVVYTISLDGRVLSLNPAFTDITNFSVEEWIGQSFLPLFLQEDHERLLAQLQQLTSEDDSIPPTEYTLRTKDGDTILVEFASSVIRHEGELQIMGIARDVTEKRYAEEALKQAQKLDSLGMMAGGIAHDFNNLLVGMLAQTSLAERILPDDSPALKPVQKAVQAAEQAADLTRQLLAYSGRGEFEIRPLNINQLIQESLHIFELAVPKHIAVATNFYDPLPMIDTDKGQIQQIVMNLIINAAQAIGAQAGQITIKTQMIDLVENDKEFSRLTGRPLVAGPYVLFGISDNGNGIDKDTLNHIFDPFYSTKVEGYGLGLAAVLGIVRGHHGGISVRSKVGKGTTFQLVFPQGEDAVLPNTAVPQLGLGANGKGTVLVIDDELHVREAVCDILEMQGIDVLCADDGQAGVELFVQHQNEIGLILLDLSMPGLSGEETLILLKEQSEDVKVVLTSGYSESETMSQQKDSIDFLQKPYNLEQLITKVKRYL